MKLYIAGPMTGIEDYNRAAFHAAEKQLVAAGHTVYNPASYTGSEDWHDCMRVGVAELCKCDGVALLEGWQGSRGAKLETHVAWELEMRIMNIECWV